MNDYLGCLGFVLFVLVLGFVFSHWDEIMRCFGHC